MEINVGGKVGYLAGDAEGMLYNENHSLLLLGVKINRILVPVKLSIRNPAYTGLEDGENHPFILSPHSEDEINGEDGGTTYFEQHNSEFTRLLPNGSLARNLPKYCCLPAGLLRKNPDVLKNPVNDLFGSYIIKDLDPLFRICFLFKAELIGVGIDFHDRSGSHPLNESGLVQVLQEKDLVSGMINEFGFDFTPEDLQLFNANIEVVYHIPKNPESSGYNFNNSRIIGVLG